MNSRTPHVAVVRERVTLAEHLVRLVLETPDGFASTGVPDEWLALTVPGQFQTRYYTVRSLSGGRLSLDVVIHDEGLVTEWAQTDCVGDELGLGHPKGSFDLPEDAGWVVLAGDLTALPAMARIAESVRGLPVHVHAEVPDGPMPDYVTGPVSWYDAPSGTSELAAIVRAIEWPEGPGYFWMAGESAQMRDVRRHALPHDGDVRCPGAHQARLAVGLRTGRGAPVGRSRRPRASRRTSAAGHSRPRSPGTRRSRGNPRGRCARRGRPTGAGR